uniref:Tyrosine recombinase XerC n=1 Tax=Pseudomonas syringae TaxID=317 RepID=I3W0J3_PSESX|nr:Tyrosine recombinase XerC [Pseudomonas syringae]
MNGCPYGRAIRNLADRRLLLFISQRVNLTGAGITAYAKKLGQVDGLRVHGLSATVATNALEHVEPNP